MNIEYSPQSPSRSLLTSTVYYISRYSNSNLISHQTFLKLGQDPRKNNVLGNFVSQSNTNTPTDIYVRLGFYFVDAKAKGKIVKYSLPWVFVYCFCFWVIHRSSMHNSVMILLVETVTTSSTVELFIYYSDELSFNNIFFGESLFLLRLSAHWNILFSQYFYGKPVSLKFRAVQEKYKLSGRMDANLSHFPADCSSVVWWSDSVFTGVEASITEGEIFTALMPRPGWVQL